MSACSVPRRRVSSAAVEKREATSTAAGKQPIFVGGSPLASDRAGPSKGGRDIPGGPTLAPGPGAREPNVNVTTS